ncbi:hypothetical protein EIP91_009154 [Steccherinum ochraceum]|uniref:Uncharacterized protein n=1 Tax=Steccherinum ochraceum TaxID=92696 RepID=A0A4R0R7J3_9APHY|nr:hypothetical protein EIP91_009154 [Steccherinum ochraceum]
MDHSLNSLRRHEVTEISRQRTPGDENKYPLLFQTDTEPTMIQTSPIRRPNENPEKTTISRPKYPRRSADAANKSLEELYGENGAENSQVGETQYFEYLTGPPRAVTPPHSLDIPNLSPLSPPKYKPDWLTRVDKWGRVSIVPNDAIPDSISASSERAASEDRNSAYDSLPGPEDQQSQVVDEPEFGPMVLEPADPESPSRAELGIEPNMEKLNPLDGTCQRVVACFKQVAALHRQQAASYDELADALADFGQSMNAAHFKKVLEGISGAANLESPSSAYQDLPVDVNAAAEVGNKHSKIGRPSGGKKRRRSDEVLLIKAKLQKQYHESGDGEEDDDVVGGTGL